MHPVAKYACQYLFVQGEFGIMCPISVTDTSIYLIRKYASPELKDYLLPRMLSADPAVQWKGTQFMTEKAGGSDIGRVETVARNEGGTWRLYGEKWFCSHTDADVALMLARPEGAPDGTRGLALFALPRRLEDGTRNSYRIVRLKDKLGTRSMASGEIRFEGAVAYPVGRLDQGLKQMMDQVNLSRLSHGVRAAAMMRRCVNEALMVARHRVAFGKPIIEHPLLRRQLMKLIVPTEQALSMALCAAAVMGEADAGSSEAADALRILTPLVKFRACRDNIPVATGAMEVRGGNGYIEEWVNAAPRPRRPDRRAVGGHQQHQRARRHQPRRRQITGAQGAGSAAAAAAEGGRGPAGGFHGAPRGVADARARVRGEGGGRAGLRAAGPPRRLRALSCGKRGAAGLGGHARCSRRAAARSSPVSCWSTASRPRTRWSRRRPAWEEAAHRRRAGGGRRAVCACGEAAGCLTSCARRRVCDAAASG